MSHSEGVFTEIKFSVMSESDILNMSVLEITNTKLFGENSVQDPRLGPGVPESRVICVTCQNSSFNCPGHFGHIRLNYPIFHPLFEDEIIKVLKIFCFRCFRFIRINPDGSFPQIEKIVKWTEKKYICPHCGASQPTWSYSQKNFTIKCDSGEKQLLCSTRDIRSILSNFNKHDLEIIGITSWPENMIITVLPVVPPCCRPSLHTEEKINDDHLTVQYSEILKANFAIDPEASVQSQAASISTLIWRISVLINNPGCKGKYNTNGKIIQGFGQRLAGKDGLPRENLMGKRVDQSGRTVIGAEPTLRIDQVSIPNKMASVLSREETVCIYNKHVIDELFRKGKILSVQRNEKLVKVDSLQLGDIVNRQLQTGDTVLINRQPTLHKGSMIAFKAVLSDSKTICFNLSNAKTFNADFDGDEMNIHVPQKYNEVAELDILSSIENNILSERNGTANIVLVQDNILSLYLMSYEDTEIEEYQLHDICMYLVDLDGNHWDARQIVDKIAHITKMSCSPLNGKGVISLCFPSDFNYSNDIHFKQGVLVDGLYTKATSAKIIEMIYHLYGERTVKMVINNLQFLSNRWLSLRGFTVGFEDCLLKSSESYEAVEDSVNMCFARAEAIAHKMRHRRIREMRTQEELNNARNIGMKIARDGFHADNNFNHTVKSGSKGDFFNIAQISGVLGQQYLHGARIKTVLNDGKRTLSHYPEEISDIKDKYESNGFIRHSFLRGLSPREAYFHAVVGRSGVVSTALSTSESGYMQRKIVKLTEDIHISNKGTVIDEAGLIYQFYFSDGLDVLHSPSPDIIQNIIGKQMFTA
jgi:DNA-directed RNA polymerase beta' subunit